MPLKKYLPLNSPGVDYFLPINDQESNGDAHEYRWFFIDNDGVPIEAFNIHCTNDGGGIPQEMEIRIAGVLLANDQSAFTGNTFFSGGIGLYSNLTSYGVIYQFGTTGFYGSVDFEDGLYVGSGVAQFTNSVQCNADFSQNAGYHDVQTRPRYSWTTVASAGNMDLDFSRYIKVTGNTTINRISKQGCIAGTPVTLKFASNPSMTNAAVASGDYLGIKFSGGSFAPAAGNNITLVLNEDETFWEETSRSLVT